MALFQDVLKGNLLVAAAMGATALVLPKLLPDLSPPLRSAVKSGLSLFLESESEAEGGIINRLAGNALQSVLNGLSGPGTDADRRRKAEQAVEGFKRTARHRARRYGRDEAGRSARYHRHIAALRRAVKHARAKHSGAKGAALDEISAKLDEA